MLLLSFCSNSPHFFVNDHFMNLSSISTAVIPFLEITERITRPSELISTLASQLQPHTISIFEIFNGFRNRTIVTFSRCATYQPRHPSILISGAPP